MTHDLTQEELAQLVGASRETVNKALADFAHARLAAPGGPRGGHPRRRAPDPPRPLSLASRLAWLPGVAAHRSPD